MSAGARVASFGALLVALFALAVLAGRTLDPATEAAVPAGHGAPGGSGADAHDAAAAHGGGADAHATAPAAGAAAASGLRLVAQPPTTFSAGRPGRLTFRVVDARGQTLRDFETEQARRMHVIVVRRDLRRFQHLHPTQAADGAWSTPLTLPDAGVYHAFADFRTGGERTTLGVDLFAGGEFEPLALPPATPTARVDGYDVRLEQRHGARDPAELRFAVSRGGTPVTDLQPHLGARGHLVMLRAGDLAYAHVHPLTTDALAFATEELTPGRYRLFLQFRHEDKVHTAAFTRTVTP
ncbi:MAG: hypothetical protein QOI64_2339 [Solirubrobacteraceae bacterium]|nr:hypothetical protein [Solirubrobacteraceae bacterium]